MDSLRTAVLFVVCLLVPALAQGATTGLGSVSVKVTDTPEQPKQILERLNALDGYGNATWDPETLTFMVIAEDSTTTPPRLVRDVVRESGADVETAYLDFIDGQARIENGLGWLYSNANQTRYFMLFCVQTTRFWPFQQRNRWGPNVPMRFHAEAFFGKIDSLGVADPDSVKLVTFEPNKTLTDQIDAERKQAQEQQQSGGN